MLRVFTGQTPSNEDVQVIREAAIAMLTKEVIATYTRLTRIVSSYQMRFTNLKFQLMKGRMVMMKPLNLKASPRTSRVQICATHQ